MSARAYMVVYIALSHATYIRSYSDPKLGSRFLLRPYYVLVTFILSVFKFSTRPSHSTISWKLQQASQFSSTPYCWYEIEGRSMIVRGGKVGTWFGVTGI